METDNTTKEIGLVFSMHKVGTSTVMQSLREIGLLPERGFAENLDYLVPLSKYKGVVTPVRDPIARNISFFFERFGNDILAIDAKFSVKGLLKHFFESIEHTYPLTWFQNVYQKTFGIDVYKEKFNKSRGWAIIDERYLLVRTDKMEKALPDAFESLYGKRPPGMHKGMTMESRPYGYIYAQFVGKVKFPEKYVESLYNSRFMKHFFLKSEIERLTRRWVNGL